MLPTTCLGQLGLPPFDLGRPGGPSFTTTTRGDVFAVAGTEWKRDGRTDGRRRRKEASSRRLSYVSLSYRSEHEYARTGYEAPGTATHTTLVAPSLEPS